MAHDEFICEPLTPVVGAADTEMMARAEPGLPWRFVWRGEPYRVLGVVRKWKSSSRERGGTEMYLRRHWYEVLVQQQEAPAAHPLQMTLYCDRQAKDHKHPKQRWFVYTVRREDADSRAAQ